MTEDDELREAGDPMTPGERLRELLGKHRPDDWFDRRSVEAARPRILAAVLRNPGLPPDALRVSLLRLPRPPARNFIPVWHNPLVEVFLMSEPRREYRDAALQLMRVLERDTGVEVPVYFPGEPDDALMRRVKVWSALDDRGSPALVEVKELVRRLASLFGLPWPTPSSPVSSSGSR